MAARPGLFSRLRSPLAAVLAVAGLGVGGVAAMSTPASAADGDLVASATLVCETKNFPGKLTTWNAQFTISALRPAGGSQVTVIVTSNKMANGSPVDMEGLPLTNTMTIDAGGTSVNLSGSGTVTALGGEEFAMPELRGTFTSAAENVALAVTKYGFEVDYLGTAFTTECLPTPATGAPLGTVVFAAREVPPAPVTPTPTTTTKPTATPKPSGKPSAKPTKSTSSGASKGTPATGSAAFACVMSIGSKFDYKADIQVSGSRASAGDPIALVAKVSDLPGIAPVPIEGDMEYSLDVEVGGKKATLKSTDVVSVPANQKVAVADLTGEVAADGEEMDVAVTKFSFMFPSQSIGADCTTAKKSLGTMKVGSEPVETDSSSGGSGGGTTSASGGGTALPQTGGGDALPVIGLWALALTLLGAAGLLCVPQVARRKA